MIDIKQEDLLDIIFSLTHTQDIDGNPIPNYCFASDLTMDLDCSEEEIAKIALNNNYLIYKVFPGETMIGGLVIIPKDGTIEPVEKMYNDFYGEVPEISQMSLKDDELVLDEAIRQKSRIVARDPNAQAMWGRTRHRVELPKKGKGSFKRHTKHKTNEGLDLESTPVNEIRKADSDTYKKLFEEDAAKYGATIVWDTDIYPDRQYAFWYGPVCTIHYKGLAFSIFTNEYGEFTYKGKTIRTIEDAEDEGFFTDDDLNNPEVEWNDDDAFYTWIFKDGSPDRGIGMQNDLNWDTVSMLEDALNVDILLTDVFEEAMTEYFNDQDDVIDEELDIEATADESIINLNKGQKIFLYDELIRGADDGRYDYMKNKEIYEKPWYIFYDIELSNEEFGPGEEADEFCWHISINGDDEFEQVCLSQSFIDDIKNIPESYTSMNFTLSEKLDKNYLKLLAKKHKKTDKKGAMGWWNGSHPHQPTVKGATLNKNAGNVEANIAHFNHVMGNSSQADGSIGAVGVASSGAMGEDLELDSGKPYTFSFHKVKDYVIKGYDYSSEDSIKDYWYARIPEAAMKVSRDDFETNKLLHRRKNKHVLDGVRKFFNDHPKAKWCVIECQDNSKYDKYINVYRVLMECKGRKSIKPLNDELDLDIVKAPRSPSNIRFEAHPREYFMHKKWGRQFQEFKLPANGFQFFKSDFENYQLCNNAKKELIKFFSNNPRKQYCVLLAFDKKTNTPVNAREIFGCKIDEDVEKHDTLNPILFDKNNKLKPEVREKLLQIAKEFTDGLEEDEIKFKLKDIKIVGSNCSYNYNPNSDIDLHLVMDTKSLKCPDNLYPLLYSAYRSLFNGKFDPIIKGIPVEIFVETDDTEDLNKESIDN